MDPGDCSEAIENVLCFIQFHLQLNVFINGGERINPGQHPITANKGLIRLKAQSENVVMQKLSRKREDGEKGGGGGDGIH